MTLIPFPLLSFVSVDEGVLDFTPADLVGPIVGAAVAAVVAAAVLYVLWMGVRIVKLYAAGGSLWDSKGKRVTKDDPGYWDDEMPF